MDWLFKLLELLNECSPLRAAAYMLFMTSTTYIVLQILMDGLTDMIFVIRGYRKPKKDEDTKQVL